MWTDAMIVWGFLARNAHWVGAFRSGPWKSNGRYDMVSETGGRSGGDWLSLMLHKGYMLTNSGMRMKRERIQTVLTDVGL